jgi:hypothetical protein
MLNSKPDQLTKYPLDVLASNLKLVTSCQVVLMITLTLVLVTMIRHISSQITSYKKRDCNLRIP